MDIVGTKSLVLVLFCGLTTLAAFLPWIMKVLAGGDNPERRKRVQALLCSLNYVAGGVFIATILLHLVPEVHEEMTEALHNYGVETHYPIPELVIGMGLLLFVFIEQLVLVCQGPPDADDVAETTSLTGNDGNAGNHDHHHHDHGHEANLLQTTSMIRSYALLIALSLHSIFEGIVVGLQSKTALVWELFVAIIIHKVLVAFGLGSRLLSSRHMISMIHFIGMIVVFAIMTPLGGVIGIIMSTNPSASPGMALTQHVLVGLATGSFMFVTFFEIIRFDGGHRANLLMCLLVVAGFAAIALVIMVHNPEHDHDAGMNGTAAPHGDSVTHLDRDTT